MEIVFLILMFLAPGLLIKKYDEYKSIREKKAPESSTIYETLFTTCTLSVIVTTVTCLVQNSILCCMSKEVTMSIDRLMERMLRFDFLGAYIGICAIVTVIAYRLYKKILNWVRGRQIEKAEKDYGLIPMNSDQRTVWENFFLNKERNLKSVVVSIYKDGNYVISGYLEGRNLSLNERKEFELMRVTEVEKILEHDKDKPPELKVLNYIEDSYFDMETGTLFNFYNSDYINEHWEEIMQEINS